jgi:hypothetical protein
VVTPVPPDEGRPSVPEPRASHHHRRQSLIKDQHPQGIAAPRHLGRYACGWRDGFGYGFRDALRLAGRRLPPEYWHIVEALADEFDLAGGDQ